MLCTFNTISRCLLNYIILINYILKNFISSLSWSDTSLTLAAVSARILIVALSSCIEDVVCCVEAAFSSDIAERLDITSTTVTLELSHTCAFPLITSVPCFETLMPLPTSLNLSLVAASFSYCSLTRTSVLLITSSVSFESFWRSVIIS